MAFRGYHVSEFYSKVYMCFLGLYRTTHLPNELALKMDGAEANGLKSAVRVNAKL